MDWPESPGREQEEDLSIKRRLASWKAILSFGFAAFVLAVVVVKGGIDPAALWQRLHTIHAALLVGALAVYYAAFPVRAYRWKQLLHNAYADTHREAVSEMSLQGLTEIICISWFVNCIVPAKLGDLYRAYLAKLWARISWTKTIGTIFAERIVDILVLSLLLAGTGFLVFHDRLGRVGMILALGIGLAVVGIVGLMLMRTLSHRIRPLIPGRFVHRYVAFEEGTLHSLRRFPALLGLTLLIWLMEGSRLQLVFMSLGLHMHVSGIPFAPMLFFALGGAVLTTVPLTPGGLGLVEVGLGSLMIYLGMPKLDAAAVVLVDRLLSYYSVAIVGFVIYLLSKRSHFRQ